MSDEPDLASFESQLLPAGGAPEPVKGRVIEETMEEGAIVEEIHPSLAPEPQLKEPVKGIADNDFRHVMLDLETWGKGNAALIVAIGAVLLDPKKPFDEQTYESFYARVDPMSAEKAGLRIDASTVDYWMDAKMDEARKALRSSEAVDFFEAIFGFATWMVGEPQPPGVPYKRTRKIWGKGATFDIVIMRNAFIAAQLECPWTYKDERCYRTLEALADHVEWTDMHVKQGNIKIPHHALYDATYQANGLLWIAHQLKLSIG
jgi:exodeoxyribonuclease VIII